MITGRTLSDQQKREVLGDESADEQYVRLGIDRQDCREHFGKMGMDPMLIAVMLGGLCMGLELSYARSRDAPRDNGAEDDFLESLPENDKIRMATYDGTGTLSLQDFSDVE